jgi:hypothetical protein
MAGKSDPNFGVANRDQPEKCVVVVTVDTTGLVKSGAMLATSTAVAACSHVLAMAKSQTFQTACPHGTLRRPSYGLLRRRIAAAGALTIK